MIATVPIIFSSPPLRPLPVLVVLFLCSPPLFFYSFFGIFFLLNSLAFRTHPSRATKKHMRRDERKPEKIREEGE